MVYPHEFDGLSVALFFSSRHNPRCCAFTAFLNRFYQATNQDLSGKKIEVILVSVDETEQDLMAQSERIIFPYLSFHSPCRKRLIADFRLNYVAKTQEMFDGPIFGLPRLEVIAKDGTVVQSLESAGGDPWHCLSHWDLTNHRWPGKPADSESSLASMVRHAMATKSLHPDRNEGAEKPIKNV